MNEVDTNLQILQDLKEVVDAPKECEHATHGIELVQEYHDDGPAKWFISGGHECGRTNALYVCDMFAQQGLAGNFNISCMKCGHLVAFKEYVKTMIKI